RSAAESVEQRAGTKGNAGQLSTRWTQSRISVTQVLRQNTAVDTLGGSRMRESRTYGSVRGARGNSRPYREPAMSVHGRFCCKSRLREAAKRDSVLLTRIAARSTHDGPFEE